MLDIAGYHTSRRMKLLSSYIVPLGLPKPEKWMERK